MSVALYAEHCMRCGNLIEVCSPSWLKLQLKWTPRLQRGKGVWDSPVHAQVDYDYDAAICMSCAAGLAPEPIVSEIRAQHDQLQSIRNATELKAPCTLFHTRHEPMRWREINADVLVDWYFTVLVDGEPAPEWNVTALELTVDDDTFVWGERFTILILGQTIAIAGIEATAQVTWPCGGLRAPNPLVITGWESISHGDMQRLIEAARLLYRDAIPRRGKVTRADTVRKVAEVMATHGPQLSLAKFCKITGEHDKTMRRRFGRWSVTWSELRAEAEKLV